MNQCKQCRYGNSIGNICFYHKYKMAPPVADCDKYESTNAMNVKVRITDLDLFKEFLNLVVDFLKDERLDENLKNEYNNKIDVFIDKINSL